MPSIRRRGVPRLSIPDERLQHLFWNATFEDEISFAFLK
jgi:hypothetical protein